MFSEVLEAEILVLQIGEKEESTVFPHVQRILQNIELKIIA